MTEETSAVKHKVFAPYYLDRGFFIRQNIMKKFLTFAFAVIVALTATLFVACKKEPLVIKESDTYVVIKVETDKIDLTLANYMASLQEYQNMFAINDGMVTSINGIENASDWSACWMLYTDDYSEDCSNASYGTIEYKQKIYNSSMWGAEKLVVKNSCTYIWIYQTF